MATAAPPLENSGMTEDAPDPQMIPDSEAPQVRTWGEFNKDIPEQIKNALIELVRKFQDQEEYDRRREVILTRRLIYYERGFQHVYANERTGIFGSLQAGVQYDFGNKSYTCGNYIDDYDIFSPFFRTIASVLTQNPPGVDFLPKNPDLSEDQQAAEAAESYRSFYDFSNDVKTLQMKIVRGLGLSGRTIAWTRTEANAAKWGLNDQGSPRRNEITSIYGTLESKVPITAYDATDCLYCFLSDDINILRAKAKYPDFADKITAGQNGIGEQQYERAARLGIYQGARGWPQVGSAYSHLITEMKCFVRPDAYADDSLNSDSEEEPGRTLRDVIEEAFPEGIFLVACGETYVGSRNCCMDDEVTFIFPYEGEGMFRKAFMEPMVAIQDRFSLDMNAYAECKDYGWGVTWHNGEVTDIDAVRSQEVAPGAHDVKKARTSMAMEDDFYVEASQEIPQTYALSTDNLKPLAEFILAAPPALQGGAQEDTKTASGYAQARAQAMGQQGMIWAQIQKGFASIYKQAALLASRNPDHAEEIVIPGKGQGRISFQKDRLSKGKFNCYADEDSSLPETTAQKRSVLDKVVQLWAQSPLGMQILAVPDNVALINNYNGLSEIVIPQTLGIRRQQFEIEQLLMQAPLPPDPAAVQAFEVQKAAAVLATQAGGAPAPEPAPPGPEPSIPIDPEIDYHQWHWDYCQEWLNGEECQKQLADGNETGVLNVRLHALKHKAVLDQQAAQAAMMQAAMSQKPGGQQQPQKPKQPAVNSPLHMAAVEGGGSTNGQPTAGA